MGEMAKGAEGQNSRKAEEEMTSQTPYPLKGGLDYYLNSLNIIE